MKRYKYSFYAKNIPLLLIVGIIMLDAWLMIYIAFYKAEVKYRPVFILISISVSFVILLYHEQCRRKKYLMDVCLGKNGLKGWVRIGEAFYFPQGFYGELKWKDITAVEIFKWPDKDATYAQMPGFRLISGDKRIVIYDNITMFRELLIKVNQKIKTNKTPTSIKG